MMRTAIALTVAFSAFGAQDVGPLQKSLNDLEVKGPWHYNDLPSGFAEARKSGKPMLVVFR